MTNVLGFAGQTVFIAMTQLCHCLYMKAAINTVKSESGYVSIKLYLPNRVEYWHISIFCQPLI